MIWCMVCIVLVQCSYSLPTLMVLQRVYSWIHGKSTAAESDFFIPRRKRKMPNARSRRTRTGASIDRTFTSKAAAASISRSMQVFTLFNRILLSLIKS